MISATDIVHVKNSGRINFKTPSVDKDLDELFLKHSNNKAEESLGESLTTFKSPNILLEIPSLQPILGYINSVLENSRELLGVFDKFKVLCYRAWANKVFEGCSGSCHNHYDPTIEQDHFTCVFYYEVPEHSSNLVIVNDETNDLPYELLDKDKCCEIEVEHGDVVIMKSKVKHAVSYHRNKKARVCFVIDYFYI